MNGQRTMSMWAAVVLGVATAALPASAPADEQETIQRAADQAVRNVSNKFQESVKDPAVRGKLADVKTVAVLPIGDAEDLQVFLADGMKAMVSQSGFRLITRDDRELDDLLTEIKWSAKNQDVMDPATVQKFGRLKGVDAILYGRVWHKGVNLWNTRGVLRISAQLARVDSGETVWHSGHVDGQAYLHWSDALTRFWRYPAMILGILLVLAAAALLARGMRRAIRHAVRPL